MQRGLFTTNDAEIPSSDSTETSGSQSTSPQSTSSPAEFPCQDLSIAGRGAGFDGYRSSLFFELARILHDARPAWFVFENVPGLLSPTHAEDFATVIEGITGFRPAVPADGWRNAGVAFGPLYSVAWRVLDAQFFGVAQQRRRVFLVGHRLSWQRAAAVLFDAEDGEGNLTAGRSPRREVGSVPSDGSRIRRGEIVGTVTAARGRGYRVGAEDARDGRLIVQNLAGTITRRTGKGVDSTNSGAALMDNERGSAVIVHRVAQTVTRNIGKTYDSSGSGAGGPVNLVLTRALPGEANDANGDREGDGFPGSLDVCESCQEGPDAPRYAGAGNAVVPPLVEWICEGINAAEAVNKS